MKRARLKKVAQKPDDDLAFLPPYSEQAKYLLVADNFLSTNGSRHYLISINGSEHSQREKKAKKAA